MLRSTRGMMRSEIESSSIMRSWIVRSSRCSAGGVPAGSSRCSLSFIFIFGGAHCHADHLPESNHRAKQQPHQIEPLSVQPVIGQLAQKEPKQDRRWNNEPNLGIASERDKRILLP